MKAIFPIQFLDFEYESWAADCGLTSATVEERPGGRWGHVLHVEGSQEAIDAFASDIGWPPITMNGQIVGDNER